MTMINTSLISGVDDELIYRVAEKDLKAIEALYKKTQKLVFSTALSITKSPFDAEDISQEVFIKIIEKASLYKSEQKPLAWIYVITKNIAISYIRKRNDSHNIKDIENDINFAKIEDPYNRLIIKSALEVLSEEELEIVLLHNSGLKHKEISNMLNIPLSTILSKYNRSLAKMKKFLQEN